MSETVGVDDEKIKDARERLDDLGTGGLVVAALVVVVAGVDDGMIFKTDRRYRHGRAAVFVCSLDPL